MSFDFHCLVAGKMCPLRNLIHLLDSFKHFVDVSQTKSEEYESCRRRFNEYLDLVKYRKDGHLNTCSNFGKEPSTECDCHDYMYNTPLRMIQEIVDSIAVSYMINFEHPKTEFKDMYCTQCAWNEDK